MLVIGSRGSPLALWQANHIQSLLAARGVESRIQVIRTSGDRVTDVPISSIGTKGLFTKEIEDALLDGSVHLAVHSLKDLTTELPSGLVLAASPAREDAHDVLAGKRLDQLSGGAAVGTGSVRRAAQLRRVRPDLNIREIRGNVETRLRKLDEGQYEAIVLAAAGLKRLGLQDRITEALSYDLMCPAPGQGALGIETAESGAGREAAALLNDLETWTAITAERAVLAKLGGGCQLPVGALAEMDGDTLHLRGVVIAPGGATLIHEEIRAAASDAQQAGSELGARLLEKGADKLLEEVYADSE